MSETYKYYHLRPPLPERFWASLAQAERIIVYSLAPEMFSQNPSCKNLRGYPITREVEVVDQPAIGEVYSSLRAGAAEGTLGQRCFDPHHAVRAFLGDSTFDLIICFSCTNMLVFQESDDAGTMADMSTKPAAILGRLLQESNDR